MKKILLLLAFLSLFSNAFTQGYFVSSEGEYFNENLFKTNSQTNLQKYSASYTAVSETYESALNFIISAENNSLNITFVYGGCMDGENWQFDTTYISGVTVNNGSFTLSKSQTQFENFDNFNFRFVNVSLKIEGITRKTRGIVLEEYKMFAEIDN